MKIIREHINLFEKFSEDSDPIKDMGIGLETQIKEWIKKLSEGLYDEVGIFHSRNFISKYWGLNSDGTIDVGKKEDWPSYKDILLSMPSDRSIPAVIIIRGDIIQLPEFINFNICYGNIYMNVSNIKTLRGCPQTIYGHLCVNDNRFLDSLEHFPKRIFGNVYIAKCKGAFTEKEIRDICTIDGKIMN